MYAICIYILFLILVIMWGIEFLPPIIDNNNFGKLKVDFSIYQNCIRATLSSGKTADYWIRGLHYNLCEVAIPGSISWCNNWKSPDGVVQNIWSFLCDVLSWNFHNWLYLEKLPPIKTKFDYLVSDFFWKRWWNRRK